MSILDNVKAGDEIAHRDDWGTLSIRKVHRVTKMMIILLNYNKTVEYKYSKRTGKRLNDSWAGDSIQFLTDNVRRYIELRELRDEVWSLLKKAEDEVKNMDNFKCINIIKFLKGELDNVDTK